MQQYKHFFQGFVFYTAHTNVKNYFGYVKINDTNRSPFREFEKKLYHLSVYDNTSQAREPTGERCDSVQTGCSQICVNEDDVGNTACLCLDGFELDRTQGRECLGKASISTTCVYSLQIMYQPKPHTIVLTQIFHLRYTKNYVLLIQYKNIQPTHPCYKSG